MQKIFFNCLIFVFSLQPLFVSGQQYVSPAKAVKEEKNKLLMQLNSISGDSDVMYGISRIIESKVDHLSRDISTDGSISLLEKEKALRSLVFFMKELSESITERKMELYDIPGAIDSYETVLKALVHHKPFTEVMKPLSPRRSQLLASAFTQYNGYALLDDITVYKRMATTPEFILRFLEAKPGFRFADSLVTIAAASDPVKIVSYLNDDRPGMQDRIRRSKNQYVQQIVSLSGEKSASELLPLVTQIAKNEITPDEIREMRLDINKYFQLLVNTMVASKESKDPSFIFQKVLRKGIREKSLVFYVNQVNELHSSADATRFASVKDLRAEDLYYIITSAGDELYTSSYLGLYKRLMERMKDSPADSIFQLVQFDNFRTFMRLAANYNVLSNFLSNMPVDNAAIIMKRFISFIETDTGSGLEKAMDIADCFTGLDSAGEMMDHIQTELQSNLRRCKSSNQYFGVRLYTILLQVFRQVKQKDTLSSLWSSLGNYEVLPRNELQDKKGEITELVLFYGDKDGVASFNSFQKLFNDSSKWKVAKNDSWLTARSRTDEPIVIYANLPLDNKQELDQKAQEALVNYLKEQSIEPSVLIHRGHSYHLYNTLKRLTPAVKLAILGSCGGYNSAISIATISPDVQIIGSKKTGSMSINDPIIEVINETLKNKRDLSWPEIWEKLSARFSKDEIRLNLFSEYIPPAKNVGLFVLKLFNLHNRPAELVKQ